MTQKPKTSTDVLFKDTACLYLCPNKRAWSLSTFINNFYYTCPSVHVYLLQSVTTKTQTPLCIQWQNVQRMRSDKYSNVLSPQTSIVKQQMVEQWPMPTDRSVVSRVWTAHELRIPCVGRLGNAVMGRKIFTPDRHVSCLCISPFKSAEQYVSYALWSPFSVKFLVTIFRQWRLSRRY